MKSIEIGGQLVGADAPCFIMAEGGVNHDGEVEKAHALIDAAKAAHADAVKFQTFVPESLASEAAENASYARTKGGFDSQREMLSRLHLDDAVWTELAAHARDLGLIFLSTAFDAASADLVESLGVPAFKVPSGELTNLALVENLASRGRPLLISTGMADESEVVACLDAARSAPGVCLLHCVSAYPAQIESSNLRAMVYMAERFDVPVGWSDHTLGSDSAVAAVALGACVLEKHLTLNRGLTGPDHAASLEPEEFLSYVKRVRSIEAALGDGVKRPARAEEENRLAARRSWHASRPLRAGEIIREGDVQALRPEVGIPVSRSIVGCRMAKDLRRGEPIKFEDVHGLV